MRLCVLLVFTMFCVACQSSRTDNVSKEKIEFVKSMALLDSNEKVLHFYSTMDYKKAAGFFTNKKVVSYAFLEEGNEKPKIEKVDFKDIVSIDTFYNPGWPAASYVKINIPFHSWFQIYGPDDEIECHRYFNDLIMQWKTIKN